jgi:hypothetical protein
MAVTLTPGSHRGFFFLFYTKLRRSRSAESNPTRDRILDNNGSKPIEFRQFTAAEFARLSPSMQLMLLAIRQAQLTSRKAIAPTAERKRRRDDL